MGLVGREIIQTRTWMDPNSPPPPSLNYKETFPITVFEAVRLEMDKNGPTLIDILERIKVALDNKQPKFPGKPSNYLMTFAGEAGAVGAIAISHEIPWDPTKQRTDRIPSERAVGRLLYTLGLVNEDGSVDENGRKIRWSDIIGRPIMYDSLGTNDNGFMTQKSVNDAIDEVRKLITESTSNIDIRFDVLNTKITNHIYDGNNPHGITIDKIGGVSKEEFQSHLDQYNPHKLTPEILGLGNVDNTKDIDKPISRVTQEAIDAINSLLEALTNEVGSMKYLKDITYDQKSGALTATYSDESTFTMHIPIDGLIDEITYDKETKELVITELNGESKRVSVHDLFVRYLGSIGTHITVLIDDYNGYDEFDRSREINRSKVRKIWNENGEGYEEPEDKEINKAFIDMTWNNGGVDYQDPTGQQMNYDIVKKIWDTNGEGYIEPIPNQVGNPEKSGYHIIRAMINEHSITSDEMSDNAIETRSIKDQSITEEKIHDLSITTIKLSDGSVTTEKIAELSVTNSRLTNRSVNGRVLFSSNISDRILAVRESNSDPIWTQVVSEMIASGAIEARNIARSAVTTEKINNHAITSAKIEDGAVINSKLATNSITNDKIVKYTISGDRIASNPIIEGIISVTDRPDADASNNQVPDTRWICDKIKTMVISNENLGDRIVDGRTLFTSSTRHRVLAVLRANSDPVWSTIDNDMMADHSIDTRNYVDLSIIGSKIRDNVIDNRHMMNNSISTRNIVNDSVTLEKISRSDNANMILAAITENSNPSYTKVSREMIANYAIGDMQIEDRSISLAKLKTSEVSNRILGVVLRNTDPIWTQVSNQMIGDRAVDGRTLFTAPGADLILGVTAPGVDPEWLKVGTKMLDERIIRREHIEKGAIWQEHLQEKIIESKHIVDWSIKQNNIAPRAITGTELFTSPIPNRVLAVTTAPYSNPAWLQVTSDMIEDGAVTKEKMMRSEHPYRVLGTTQANVPPEYTMITHQFIVDGTIIPQKLVHDFTLFGTPQLTVHPNEDAYNHQLTSTAWVKDTVARMLTEFDPTILFDAINSDRIKQMIKEAIDDRSIDGSKLFTHPVGPRVLGITKANEDVEFLLIEEELIADGAVTSNKIQRDVHLLGSPVLDVRPSAGASDNSGEGSLIPDCQWVIDRIREGIGSGDNSGGTGGSSGAALVNNSVNTIHIVKRAVTGDKLFTSTVANRVLAVLSPNTSPQYTSIINGMIDDRAVDGRTLFSSTSDERVLGVKKAGESPEYLKITHGMIGDGVVSTNNIRKESITNDKIANGTITREKLAGDAFSDNSISTQKIIDKAVTTEKIADKAVTGSKLANKLVLPVQTTVESTAPELKSVRNITISPNIPTNSDGKDGDIWITYI